MVSPTSRVLAAIAATTFAVAATLFSGAAASAVEEPTEDSRATIVAGNLTSCGDGDKGADVGGDEIPEDHLTFTGGEEDVDQYLDITAIADGVTVTGIVVKGGTDSNVYVPGENDLSATPPWLDLRAPLNDGGNIPQISHWFVCGTVTTTTTTTTSTTETTTETTTTTAPATTTTEPLTTTPSATTTDSSITATSSASGAPATTTSGAVAPTGGSGPLADTGFSGGQLIWAGALLILLGGGALWFARSRRSHQ